jgi:hypothetical protein
MKQRESVQGGTEGVDSEVQECSGIAVAKGVGGAFCRRG